MSRDRLQVIQPLLAPLSEDLVELFADQERLAVLRDVSAPGVHPDFETTFLGAGGMVMAGPFRGLAGFFEGWRDWLSSFASYRVEVERVFEHDDRVIVLVRQTGHTIHDGVAIPSPPSAAVVTLREGRVARVAFYLDRAEAAEAEGFELP
jgi:ketosteroid isomerase-like protein